MSISFSSAAHSAPSRDRVRIVDLEPPTSQLLLDAKQGLGDSPRTLPCKYFYDSRGSELFEEITRLPEYYPTRTELSIMGSHSGDMAGALGSNAMLVEFGSGSGRKTGALLEAMDRPAGCVLIDISESALRESIDELSGRFPHLEFVGVRADYTTPLLLPKLHASHQRVVAYFPGSTIGNFTRAEAGAFLKRVRRLVGDEGALLIGVDRVKDPETLKRAYDDSSGVTAAFNKNVLVQLKDAGAELDPEAFSHEARYNPEATRIEMHLVSEGTHEIRIDGRSFQLAAGESICTEHSHKYEIETFSRLSSESGFRLERHWSDPQDWFSVCYLESEG